MEPKRPLIPDWMVSPAYGPDLRFERIAINEGALCIECKACGRHTALTKQNCEHIRLGSKRLVKSMKFRCQNQSCGSAEVRTLQRAHSDEATMWLAGDPLPDGPLSSSTSDSDAGTKEYRLRFGMGGFGKLRRVGGTTSIRLYEYRDEGVCSRRPRRGGLGRRDAATKRPSWPSEPP
jgi:hypothetical protein